MHLERIIESRLLQNLLFWLFFAVVPFSINLGHFGSAANMYTDIQYYVECAVLGYLNNLILMPRYFDRKKYGWYLILVLVMICSMTLLSTQVTLILSPNYPNSLLGNMYEAIDFSLFVIAFGSGHLVRSYIQQTSQINQLQEDKLKTEIEFLKSQINPHMLFNTLNTIYSYSLSESKKTPEMILKLSGIMRYMLYETDEAKVTLAKELAYIKDYVSMQELRIGSRGSIQMQVTGSPEGLMIAPMLMIAFIENSFKHSMDTMSSHIMIAIHFVIDQEGLQLEVTNNYEEVDKELIGGIGNENVKKRLELIYPGRHELSVQKEKQTYRVNLRLKLVA